jgi:predicted N-acetyltransferase YhbS
MVTIRHERSADAVAREALLDLSFGACRFAKTSQRLREGRRPAEGLSLVATDRGRVIGTVRLWHVAITSPPALRGRSASASSSGGGRRWAYDPSPDLRPDPPLSGEGESDEPAWSFARSALLLGPLAVHPDWRNCGAGAALMQDVLAQAQHRGHGAVLLVGDAPYYERFGFSAETTSLVQLPGPYERNRLLARELRRDALRGAQGMVIATGLPVAPFSRRVLTPAAASAIPLPRAA